MQSIRYEKKETVERFVGTLVTRGAYSPFGRGPITNTCTVCGFTFDDDDDAIGCIHGKNRTLQFRVLTGARFCPICGARFEDESLFPEIVEEPPALWEENYGGRENEFKKLEKEELDEGSYRALIGDELYEELMRQPEELDQEAGETW